MQFSAKQLNHKLLMCTLQPTQLYAEVMKLKHTAAYILETATAVYFHLPPL